MASPRRALEEIRAVHAALRVGQPSEAPVPRGEEAVSSDVKFSVHSDQCSGFYQTVITIATAFLGGSLLFLEKIAPHPMGWTLWLLGTGWACLLAAIFCITDVRRTNMLSMRHALRSEQHLASDIDRVARRLCFVGQWTLIAGMLLVSAYGIANVTPRKHDPSETDMARQVDITKVDRKGIPLSISGGDTVRKPVSRSPVQQPKTPPAGSGGGQGGSQQ